MKKIISSIAIMLVAVILFTGVYASGPSRILTENIPAGTYIIGTHAFDRNTNEVYDGTLTVKHIMLAAKTIEGDSIEDMNVYYKRARDGVWVDAITNEPVQMPETVTLMYYNTKITGSITDYDAWNIPTAQIINVLKEESIELQNEYQQKYTLELFATNCDEYEVYYKTNGETDYKKIDNIKATIDENNRSIIDVVIPGELGRRTVSIKIRGVNNSEDVKYSEYSEIEADLLVPGIYIEPSEDEGIMNLIVSEHTACTAEQLRLYLSTDKGQTYNEIEFASSEYNDGVYPYRTSIFSFEQDNDVDYWFKATYTTRDSLGKMNYITESEVFKHENIISDVIIEDDSELYTSNGITYRRVTATLVGDLKDWNCFRIKINPNGSAFEYATIVNDVIATPEGDLYYAPITFDIPNKLAYNKELDIYKEMTFSICGEGAYATSQHKTYTLEKIENISHFRLSAYECLNATEKFELPETLAEYEGLRVLYKNNKFYAVLNSGSTLSEIYPEITTDTEIEIARDASEIAKVIIAPNGSDVRMPMILFLGIDGRLGHVSAYDLLTGTTNLAPNLEFIHDVKDVVMVSSNKGNGYVALALTKNGKAYEIYTYGAYETVSIDKVDTLNINLFNILDDKGTYSVKMDSFYGLDVIYDNNKFYAKLNSNSDLAEIYPEATTDTKIRITGIDEDKVAKVFIKQLGSDLRMPGILFLMEDGTVYQIKVYDALANGNTIASKVENVSDVVDIMTAYDESGVGLRYLGLRKDGTYYSL